MKKILLSAGEVSGDVHGTYLVKELKKLLPDAYFFGMGSEKLLAEGVDIKVDISKRGSIGIFEALPNLLPVYFAYLRMVELMKRERPDLVILIDSQGINMPLARAAKKLGLKTVYYIAPQEWLWGTAKGVKRVSETIGLIVSIFEKEHETYRQAGGNSVYFGHPLVDIIAGRQPKPTNDTRIETVGRKPVIALCPGSRTQEIKGLLPIFLKAAEKIKQSYPDAQFVIPAASTEMIKNIFKYIGEDLRPRAIVGQTYEILAGSDLAICASGTINLEASLLGVPNMMVYKLSPLTYWVGKYILKLGEKLPYFSMPNLLLEEKAIPELVMGDANPERVTQEALLILNDLERQKKMKTAFARLKIKLGAPGVISRVAQEIVKFS